MAMAARGPEKALNWRTRVRIAAGTARGLLQLHVVEHMIHGNLTASNILVDNVDSNASAAAAAPSSSSAVICPKISEYGISRLMTPAAVSNVIATAGSSGYHAPELTKSNKPTTKSDVYSFGILLLELLTGTKLFFSRCCCCCCRHSTTELVFFLQKNLQQQLHEPQILNICLHLTNNSHMSLRFST